VRCNGLIVLKKIHENARAQVCNLKDNQVHSGDVKKLWAPIGRALGLLQYMVAPHGPAEEGNNEEGMPTSYSLTGFFNITYHARPFNLNRIIFNKKFAIIYKCKRGPLVFQEQ
jgi:hypothetical protein